MPVRRIRAEQVRHLSQVRQESLDRMAWIKLGYSSGWNCFWENHKHKMYAKENLSWSNTKNFDGRYSDRATAWAVFEAWARRR